MSLNIKNEETCRLAGELAKLTGETMTAAITVALRERLERMEDEHRPTRPKATLDELRAISRSAAMKLRGTSGPGSTDHGDWLYDEYGLPK